MRALVPRTAVKLARSAAATYRRLAICLFSSRAQLVLSAGMPRSGSTWLFNVARIVIERSERYPKPLLSAWIDDWSSLQATPARTILLKLHHYDPLLIRCASRVLYSYRDLRDALASANRKFDMEPTVGLAAEWVQLYRQYRPLADYTMRYEAMLEDKPGEIAAIIRALRATDVSVADVLSEMEQLEQPESVNAKQPYDSVTLLHKGHVTDGRHGSWTESLDSDLVARIEREFGDWLREHRYM